MSSEGRKNSFKNLYKLNKNAKLNAIHAVLMYTVTLHDKITIGESRYYGGWHRATVKQ
jgi:hypothetical protein